MKKIIIFLMLFISTVSMFGITGCFDESENPLLFEEVMQGRSPETLNNLAHSQPSINTQDQSENEEETIQLNSKPSVFGDNNSMIGANNIIVAWDEDGFVTLSRPVEDPETGNTVLETYKINDLGDTSVFDNLPQDIYCGKINVSDYEFTITMDTFAHIIIGDHSTGKTLFYSAFPNFWQLGENEVAKGNVTQEQLDAAKSILEKIE